RERRVEVAHPRGCREHLVPELTRVVVENVSLGGRRDHAWTDCGNPTLAPSSTQRTNPPRRLYALRTITSTQRDGLEVRPTSRFAAWTQSAELLPADWPWKAT